MLILSRPFDWLGFELILVAADLVMGVISSVGIYLAWCARIPSCFVTASRQNCDFESSGGLALVKRSAAVQSLGWDALELHAMLVCLLTGGVWSSWCIQEQFVAEFSAWVPSCCLAG